MLTAELPFSEDNLTLVGVGLWLGSGLAAWIVARIVPLGGRDRLWVELAAALVTALVLGVVATALDFGGWNEPDWRAGVFAALGAFAAIGGIRTWRTAAK